MQTKFEKRCNGVKTEASKEDLIEVVSRSSKSNEVVKIIQDIQITAPSMPGGISDANTETSVMINLLLEELEETAQGPTEVNTHNEETIIPHEMEVTEVSTPSKMSLNEKSVTPTNDIIYVDSDTEEKETGETSTGNEDKPIYISDTDEKTEAQKSNEIRNTRWNSEGNKSEVTTSSGTNLRSVDCKTCKLTFSTEDSLRRHMKVMHAQYKCVRCQFVFFDEPSLKAHFLRKHKYTGKCLLCETTFDSEESSLRHYRTAHSEIINDVKIWKCHKCKSSITTEEGIQKHLETTHAITGSFCPICQKGFLEMSEVMDHLKASHVVVTTKPSCSGCKLVCANEAHLMLHYQNMHVNKGKDQCISREPLEEGVDCSKITTKAVEPSSMKVVEEIQAKYVAEMKPSKLRKKFECHICLMRFKRDLTLAAHLKERHDVQVFQENNNQMCFVCPKCKDKFETKEMALEHIRRGHVDNFRCVKCMAYFQYQDHLKKHEESLCTFFYHDAILERYSCRHCGLILKNSQSQCTKYQCTLRCRYCLDSFDNEELLDSHMNTRHQREVENVRRKKAARIFPCPICKDKFPSDDAIVAHSEAKHPAIKLDHSPPVPLESILRTEYKDDKTYRKCPFCQQFLPTVSKVIHHIKRNHANQADKLSDCVTLGLYEGSPQELSRSDTSTSTSKVSKDQIVVNESICYDHTGLNSVTSETTEQRSLMTVKSLAVPCPICKEDYESKEALLEHARINHPAVQLRNCSPVPLEPLLVTEFKNDIRHLKCPFCTDLYQTLSEVVTHIMKSHVNRACHISDCVTLRLYEEKPKGSPNELSSKSEGNQRATISKKQGVNTKSSSYIDVISCPICDRPCLSKEALINHSRAKHPAIKLGTNPPVPLESVVASIYKNGTTSYICPFCKIRCSAMPKLAEHIMTHKKMAHLISDCVTLGLYDAKPEGSRDKLSSRSGVDQSTSISDAILCPICERPCTSQQALISHSRIKHPAIILENGPPVPLESVVASICENGMTSYVCPFCKIHCSTIPNLAEHIMKHKKKAHLISDCVTLGLYDRKPEGSRDKLSSRSGVDQSTSISDAILCPICGRPCTSQQALISHSRAKHPAIKLENGPPVPLESVVASICEKGINSYACPFCKIHCSTIANLAEHIMKHKEKANLISDCVTLGLYDKKPGGSRHELSSRSGVNQSASISNAIFCPICEIPFTSQQDLVSHSRAKHPAIKLGNGPPRPLESVVSTIYENGLPSYVCPFCALCCSTLQNLVKHIEIHKDKAHLMSDCVSLGLFDRDSESLPDGPTNQVSNIPIVEADPRAIICPICKTILKSELDLEKHAMYKHPAIKLGSGLPIPLESVLSTKLEGDKMHYECPFCFHSYPKIGAVVEHIIREHKECTNQLSDCVSLGLYEKEHEEVDYHQTIPCPMCQEIFQSKNALEQHAKAAHPAIKLGNGPAVPLETALRTEREGKQIYYVCPFCTHSYTKISSVTLHIFEDHEDRSDQMFDCVSLGLFHKRFEQLSMRESEIDIPAPSDIPFYIAPDYGRHNDTIFRSDMPSLYNSYKSGVSRANESSVFADHEASFTRSSGRNRDYRTEGVLTTRRLEVSESRFGLKRSHKDDEPLSYDSWNENVRSEGLMMFGRDIGEYMRYRDVRGDEVLRSRRSEEMEIDRSYMENYANDELSYSSTEEISTHVYMPTASRKRSRDYGEGSRMERDSNRDRGFQCLICGCVYMSRAALDMHVKINHMDKHIMSSDDSANRDRDQRRFVRKDRQRYSRSGDANRNDQIKSLSQNLEKHRIVQCTKEGKGSAFGKTDNGNPGTPTPSRKTCETTKVGTSDKFKELEKRTQSEKELNIVDDSSRANKGENDESSSDGNDDYTNRNVDASEQRDAQTIRRITEKYDVQIMPADPNKKFECRVCLKSLNRAFSLIAHLMSSHNMPVLTGEEAVWYKCPYCSTRFQTSKLALEHARRGHVTPFRCMTCTAYFKNESDLKNHEISNCELFYHPPIETQYVCRYCKSSMLKKDLPKHMVQCEFTTRAFRCKYCLDSFDNLEYLKLHVETKHAKGEVSKALEVKTKEVKSYPCPICLRNFISEVAVKNHSSVKHALIVLGNNPPVPLESALFHYKSKKGRVHYKCIFCQQSFAKRNPTINHLKRMHGDEAFEITDGVTLAEKSGAPESSSRRADDDSHQLGGSHGSGDESSRNKEVSIPRKLDLNKKRFGSKRFNNQAISRSGKSDDPKDRYAFAGSKAFSSYVTPGISYQSSSNKVNELSDIGRPGVSQQLFDYEVNKDSRDKKASRPSTSYEETQRFGYDSYSSRQRSSGSGEVMSKRNFRDEDVSISARQNELEERFMSDRNRKRNKPMLHDSYESRNRDIRSEAIYKSGNSDRQELSSDYKATYPYGSSYENFSSRVGSRTYRNPEADKHIGDDPSRASRLDISRKSSVTSSRRISQGTFTCTVCGASFMSYTAINMHMEVNHFEDIRRF